MKRTLIQQKISSYKFSCHLIKIIWGKKKAESILLFSSNTKINPKDDTYSNSQISVMSFYSQELFLKNTIFVNYLFKITVHVLIINYCALLSYIKMTTQSL